MLFMQDLYTPLMFNDISYAITDIYLARITRFGNITLGIPPSFFPTCTAHNINSHQSLSPCLFHLFFLFFLHHRSHLSWAVVFKLAWCWALLRGDSRLVSGTRLLQTEQSSIAHYSYPAQFLDSSLPCPLQHLTKHHANAIWSSMMFYQTYHLSPDSKRHRPRTPSLQRPDDDISDKFYLSLQFWRLQGFGPVWFLGKRKGFV